MKQLPLPQQAETTDDLVDSMIAIHSVAGYLIWLIDEFERIHKTEYRMQTRSKANDLRKNLLIVVNKVWRSKGNVPDFDEETISQQQMDLYLMAEQMFKIALQLSRRSEEEVFRFKLAYENLLYSFKIDVPK